MLVLALLTRLQLRPRLPMLTERSQATPLPQTPAQKLPPLPARRRARC
jgi:hypothetical protein